METSITQTLLTCDTGGIYMYHKKNDKRSIESSTMIYESVKALIRQNKFKSMTIKDIVNHANIGRSTFYRNYDTIDDVLIKKCDEEFFRCVSYIIKQLTSSTLSKDIDMMSHFIYLFFSFWEHNSEILELLAYVDKFNFIEESLKRIIHQLLDLSNQKGLELEHPEYFIAVRVGIIKSVLAQWIKDNKAISPKDLSVLIIKQLYNTGDIIEQFSNNI